MGRDDKNKCVVCGTTVDETNCSYLTDGSCVCSKCNRKLPFYLQMYVSNHYDLTNYWNVRKWAQEALVYDDVFEPTASLGTIAMDSRHGLFCIGNYIKGKTPLLRFCDIEDFSFSFEPSRKLRWRPKTVVGDVCIHLSMRHPDFYYENTLLCNASTANRAKWFAKEADYELPERIREFEYRFASSYVEFLQDEVLDTNEHSLEKAMHLFMIDDLSSVNRSQLDEVSTQLLESFKAGGGELGDAYMAKIYRAYEILKDKVGSAV